MDEEGMTPFVELKGVSKVFPGIKANDQISCAFYQGEIHALLGENGAPAGLDVRAYNVLHHNFIAAKAGTPQLLLIQKNG